MLCPYPKDITSKAAHVVRGTTDTTEARGVGKLAGMAVARVE